MTNVQASQVKAKTTDGLSPPPILPGAPLELALALPAEAGTLALRITRMAHASVLVQWEDQAILTDPWVSEKPLYHMGESLPELIGHLPRLTAVLSSMNHYDHYDIASFADRYADHGVPVMTIAGSNQAVAAKAAGFTNVVPMSAGQTAQFGGASFHAVAANSFPSSVFRYEQAYVIEAAGRRILFSPHFPTEKAVAEIKAKFPRIDLAFLGINGLRLKPLLGRQLSMEPEDAARVCRQLDIPVCVPIHYTFHGGWVSSTFILTHKGKPEQFTEAVRRLSPRTTVVVLYPGQTLVVRPAPKA